MVHHDVDEDRQQPRQHGRPVAHLRAVDAALPGRPAVHQLVAQHVEPVEHDPQQDRRVEPRHRRGDLALARRQMPLPSLMAGHAVLLVPERREHVFVGQQRADLLREPLPHRFVDAVRRVQQDELLEIALERITLAGLGGKIARIGGIEADPQQDEAHVGVVRLRHRPAEPADRLVHPEPDCFGKAAAQPALLGLEAVE